MFTKFINWLLGRGSNSSKSEVGDGGHEAPAENQSNSRSSRSAGSAAPVAESGSRPKTPEGLCGITPEMGKDEIREKLAFLYRRHNRAASSFDTELRAEAEEMLEAIVEVRQKHLS